MKNEVYISTAKFKSLSKAELRANAFKTIMSLRGDKVVNQDKGITVEFIRAGANKVGYGDKISVERAAITQHVKDVIKRMAYNNFGNRKASDPKEVIGYLNFRITLVIDGVKSKYRIAIQLRNSGKFYYNHNEGFKKEKR